MSAAVAKRWPASLRVRGAFTFSLLANQRSYGGNTGCSERGAWISRDGAVAFEGGVEHIEGPVAPAASGWAAEGRLLNRFRRLTIRYERRADIHHAFLTLGCAIICFQQLTRFC